MLLLIVKEALERQINLEYYISYGKNLLIDFDLSAVDGDYELLKVLGLIDDEETQIVDGDVRFEADEDDDDDDDFEIDDDDVQYDILLKE